MREDIVNLFWMTVLGLLLGVIIFMIIINYQPIGL